MSAIECKNINKLRKFLDNKWDKKEKPNGQIMYTKEGDVINTYETGKVVIQGKLKYKKEIEDLVNVINKALV